MIGTVSFGALRAFVEVGRQGSIKRAAQELHVTAGAVSQQVRAVEARLGAQLLDRRGRDIQLSSEGLLLYQSIAPQFDGIDEALHVFAARRSGVQTLTISTTPSFAAGWLTGRLGRFAQAHPDLEIRLEISEQLADLREDGIDVAIRYGLGPYAGLKATPLLAPRLVAVASPALLATGSIASAADCARFPLLQDRYRVDWPRWLKGAGLSPPRSATKGASFADDALLIRAALAGLGLAVVRDIAASEELGSGRLVLAHSWAMPLEENYFVVTRPDRVRSPKIAAFVDWIFGEVERATGLGAAGGAE